MKISLQTTFFGSIWLVFFSLETIKNEGKTFGSLTRRLRKKKMLEERCCKPLAKLWFLNAFWIDDYFFFDRTDYIINVYN